MAHITSTAISAPESQRRRSWLVNAALAMSLAHLCFVRAWFSVLNDADYGYFNRIPVNAATLAGLALNMLLLASVFWLAATGLGRQHRLWPKRLGILAVLALFLIPIDFVRLNYFAISGAAMLALVRQPLVLALSAVLCLLVWRWHSLAARGVRAILLILLPLAGLTWVRLFLIMLNLVTLRQYEGLPVLAPPLTLAKSQPRIVWLVFDELDYRVTFAERPANLPLPELDRLRAESLCATAALPPSNDTLLSMPALTTGRRVVAAEPCSPQDLRLTLADPSLTATWSSLPNVFSRAQKLGFNCAVVAWYHPYDRVFGNLLTHCTWYPFPLFELGRGLTLASAMANQFWSTLAPLQLRRLELQVYQHSLSDALEVVASRQFGLSLLHLPGPHKPGIYLPHENRFTIAHFSTVQGYFDNLALTDLTLGQLRLRMESAGTWDQSWLIVSSDHGWREAVRYDGRSDLRVPFLVKAPGHAQGMEFTARFNTLLTPGLIMAILREDVRSLEAARDWLAKNLVDHPPSARNPEHDHE